MIRITAYTPKERSLWDDFVRAAKNGTFLFERGYLEYHADRFTDCSLVVRDDDATIALLPLAQHGDTLASHGGLTYGGFVTHAKMSAGAMLDVFEATRLHLLDSGATVLIYKALPHIYHQLSAEEDLYALFRYGARVMRVDPASSCVPGQRAPLSAGRRLSIKKAVARGHIVERSTNFGEFIEFENVHLHQKFGATAVHSPAELELLARRFPENIKLWTVQIDGVLAAGVVIYETATVAHTQYIASSAAGREAFALDAIVQHLLSTEYASKPWFDFGISTERDGQYLNRSLSWNKESWGARTVTYTWYEWDLSATRTGEG